MSILLQLIITFHWYLKIDKLFNHQYERLIESRPIMKNRE